MLQKNFGEVIIKIVSVIGGDVMSKFEKLITVVVPVTGRAEEAEACAESLSAQTVAPEKFEVLFVCDGADSEALTLCRKICEEKSGFTLIERENIGITAARNIGIAEAKGKYITFVDPQDKISPNTLEKLTEFFEQNGGEVDLAAYKLIPQVRGASKKSPYQYDIISSDGVYDLNDGENIYFYLSSTNFAVKNCGENTVRFDEATCVGSEVVFFYLENVKAKQKVGFVGGCEYYKSAENARLDRACDASIYAEDIANCWENRLNGAPCFVAACFAEEMFRRLERDVLLPYYLEGEEYDNQVQRLRNLLLQIDNDIILNCPTHNRANKYYLLGLKYGGELTAEFGKKIKLMHGDECLFESAEVELNFTKIKPKNGRVEVCGYIASPVFDYAEKPKLLLRVKGGSEPLEIRECSYCYDDAKVKNNTAWGFRKIFDIDKKLSFSFAVEIADKCYPVKFDCKQWVAFNSQRNEFVLNGVSLKLSESCVVLKKATKKQEKKYRLSALKKYLKTDKKVFAVRLLNYFMPNKRIWLYHDCKGIGKDNAYYQFIHDFDKNDGIERYYVVNGSVDAVREMFTNQQQKHLLTFRSSKHKLMYLKAEKIITAFIENENYLPFYADAYPHYNDLFGGEVYYLQHGVLHAHLPWKYSYDRLDISGEVVSTDYEVKNFTENYFFPQEALIKSKMPRYDRVDTSAEKKKIILFAPSWRKYLISHKGEGGWLAETKKFLNSSLYKETQAFLQSDELANLLEENDWTLEFKPHPIFAVYKDCFELKNPRIQFAEERDIAEYSIFITDYSSFVFDFVYLRRAIIYFMPDLMQFRAGMNDYRELDIPFENGFGELTQNGAQLCEAIKKIFENSGEAIAPYDERCEGFFFDKEKNSCDKIYNALIEGGSDENN